MVIGIIGGIGSGKSFVLDTLQDQYGFQLIKTDDVAKRLMLPGGICYEALVKAFGTEILSADGSLDKKKYAALIYSDPKMLALSNSIVHPASWAEVDRMIAAMEEQAGDRKSARIVVETALPSPTFRNICDTVWCVRTDKEVRLERMMRDRGYTREYAEGIMAKQADDSAFMAIADLCIDNSRSMEDTRRQIGEALCDL